MKFVGINKALTNLLLSKIKFLVKLLDKYKKFESIVFNFINNEGYEEKHIEENLTNKIKSEVKNISSLSVFYVPNDDKIKIRLFGKFKNIIDPFKYSYEFDTESIINGVRRYRLNKIFNE